jgi:hypothetical protein
MNSALKSLNNELKDIVIQQKHENQIVQQQVHKENVATDSESIGVVVIACNRPASIESHLNQILK